MIRKLILLLVVFALSAKAHSQTLIAHYTMNDTNEDHVGFHKHLLTPNCTYEKSGIKSIGKYASLESGKCDIHAVNIEELDINEFAFSMDIMVEKVEQMNVMTFNRTCRLLGCAINKEGYFALKVNNGDLVKTSYTKCVPNKWYTITISYNAENHKAKMYVDEKLVHT